MTESTWKILKLDWKTPGIFFFQKSENPEMPGRVCPSIIIYILLVRIYSFSALILLVG